MEKPPGSIKLGASFLNEEKLACTLVSACPVSSPLWALLFSLSLSQIQKLWASATKQTVVKMVLRGPRAMSPIPAVPAGKTHTVPGGARIAKEGPVPGYSGFIPQSKNYVIGHGYSDACRRAAAITDSLRHGALNESIHLVHISFPSTNIARKDKEEPYDLAADSSCCLQKPLLLAKTMNTVSNRKTCKNPFVKLPLLKRSSMKL